MKKLVIALGGNALGNNAEEQLELVKQTAKTIVDLSEEGYSVIVGHGNGPQVGMINLAMDFAANNGANTPSMPFAECGSMSQGYIGYHLQQSIKNELNKRNLNKNVATVVTQVVVDETDEAFKHLTKPVGMFYTKDQADLIAKEKGYTFVEDSGRGYRRVVASPKPQKIVELETIKQLVDNGTIVITVGGGGIPVVEENDGTLYGVAAVIDKDKSSARLAKDLDAQMLVILTAVERVCINFNKPNQEELKNINLKEASKYIEEGHFAKGSMLPKVEACVDFVEKATNGNALITSLEKAKEALHGETGTVICKEKEIKVSLA
ncbi:carbamate kinase [Romboutsia sp.]|uniref:carbamate kinase n=1 Tax=Romboutsia sp. TaxID=1965302 RepID=UPI003F3A55CE